jgi:2,4-dienoyl-CoA reductase-like NADH-dependent reductase (Old Yellow Enzyme family)
MKPESDDCGTTGDCGSVEEACSFAEMLASRGCDFVDISGGTAANTSEARTAATQSNAGAIRRHLQLHAPSCSTVVMTVGGIREPQQAEAILQDGEADLIGIGSQFL